MKKYLTSAVVALGLGSMLFAAAIHTEEAEAAPDAVAAIILSSSMPGTGEWYNAGFSGGFPLVECILGEICPCVRLASIIDAAAGRTDDGLRFDFWSSPN